MNAEKIAFLDISNQAKLIKSGQLSPVDLVEIYLERIEKWNSILCAWTFVCGDQALAQAKAMQDEIEAGKYRGVLHGIPFGVKDQMLTKGVPTSLASVIKKDFGSDRDATVVSKLQDAGAILIGKQNLHEFGKGGANTFHFGEPRNPWNPNHTPASSSSGSGIATAAGMCSFSIGEDTGGSIRGPAWAAGLAGIRPTFGRVSRYGGFMYAYTQDTFGPLTRSVLDNALVLQNIAGYDPNDPLTGKNQVPDYPSFMDGSISGLRIGLVKELSTDLDMHPDVEKAFDQMQAIFKSKGAVLDKASHPLGKYGVPLQMLTSDVEVASMLLRSALRKHWSKVDSGVRARVAAAALVPGTVYSRAMRARVLVRDQLLKLFDRHDVLIGLSHIVPPEHIRETRSTLNRSEDFSKKIAHARRMLSYPFNIANVPAMNVLCGFSNGLPMGFQVAAKPYNEQMIYRVAYAYEQEAGWFKTHPKLEATLSDIEEITEKKIERTEIKGEVRTDIQDLGRLIGLEIPNGDSAEIGLRFDSLLQSMQEIEEVLGLQMDDVDPIPPVYPHAHF